MSEYLSTAYEPIDRTPRKSFVETYIRGSIDPQARRIAESFTDKHTPLEATVALIPVAAEQETSYISKAMAAYAGQTDCGPFSILLLLNHRSGLTDDRLVNVRKTVDAVERAKRTYGDRLDIRMAMQEYDDPTIGGIRKDLWDSALILAYQEGSFDTKVGEVIGISHDIDTESMTAHYVRNVQSSYKTQQMMLYDDIEKSVILDPVYTAVRHLQPFDTHPNTARGIRWIDNSTDFSLPGAGYEEGTVIPFSHYAKSGGYERGCRLSETDPFLKDIGRIATVPGTLMFTSPRRFIDRFPSHGYGIWTENTFSDTDKCRTTSGRDATNDELREHVRRSLPRFIPTYYLYPTIDRAYENFIMQSPWKSGAITNVIEFSDQARRDITIELENAIQVARIELGSMGLRYSESETFNKLDVEEVADAHAKDILDVFEMLKR